MKRRITLETEKIVIRSEQLQFNWCESCAVSGPAVTVEQAAILIGEEIGDLYRRAEQGRVHAFRPPGGVIMICLRSLSALTGGERRTYPRCRPFEPL